MYTIFIFNATHELILPNLCMILENSKNGFK